MSREERAQARLAMTMAEDGHVDFGTFLRQAREQRGVSLQDLAVATKISARVLEALERNDPSKLPGGIFSRAFVRAYAREVGLDPDVTAATFVSAFPDESGADDMPATTSAVEAESFEQRRRIVRILVRLVGVAAIVAILAVIYFSKFRPGFLTSAPEGSQPRAAGAVVPAPLPSQSQPSATEPSSLVVPATARGEAAPPAPTQLSGQTPPPEPTPSVPPPEPAVMADGAVPPQPAPLVVVLTLAEPSWLSVSVDGAQTPGRTAGAGERLEFAVHRSMTMKVGNAGAVSVTLNGKPARALGAAGQVVTTTVTASGYESFLR